MRNAQTPLMSWCQRHLPQSVVAIAALLAVIGLIYAAHVLTLSRAVPELSTAKTRIKTQQAEIRSLTSRLEASKVRQQVAEHEARVMRQANQMLREDESNRHAELNRLQTELDFFQRLAGTSGTQSGLAIYHLELSPTGSGRVFRFVLTLTQNLRRSAIISGNVRFDLEGILQDRPLTLPWSQITDGSQPEPAFRFKYFQQLDGYLALPERFEPSHLLVSLEVKGQSKPVRRSFDWKELTAPAGPAAETSTSSQAGELEKELPESTPN
jgi:hypothetical protein